MNSSKFLETLETFENRIVVPPQNTMHYALCIAIHCALPYAVHCCTLRTAIHYALQYTMHYYTPCTTIHYPQLCTYHSSTLCITIHYTLHGPLSISGKYEVPKVKYLTSTQRILKEIPAGHLTPTPPFPEENRIRGRLAGPGSGKQRDRIVTRHLATAGAER
jgi:hypothetical protein